MKNKNKPPIQNIPLRTETGKKLREVFTQKGVFVEADYASLELRILAELEKEEK